MRGIFLISWPGSCTNPCGMNIVECFSDLQFLKGARYQVRYKRRNEFAKEKNTEKYSNQENSNRKISMLCFKPVI